MSALCFSESGNLAQLQEELKRTRKLLEQEIRAHEETRQILRKTEHSFRTFVPPQYLRFLNIAGILDITLGAHVELEASILFSDIRDFTTISETMTPAQSFEFVNSFFQCMEPAITAHFGVVDKYIGDAIMCVFNTSPDDAILGALAMLESLNKFNAARETLGYDAIRVGIGLNTGMAMLGTVGSQQRMDSTVISDAVNLAARLEELTKLYGVSILISEGTYFRLQNPGRFCLRFLDRVKIKGKARPQSIYELFDDNPESLRKAKLTTLDLFEEALAYYHMGDIENAWELLNECLNIAPDDAPARLYLERCRTRRSQPNRRAGEAIEIGQLETIEGWRAEYSVGVDEIDYQHIGLLHVIDVLADNIRAGGKIDVSEILDLLGEYVRDHFVTEERMMARYGYPFMSEHIVQHNIFKQRFYRLKEEIIAREKGRLCLLFRVHLFLIDWFINHSTRTDRHLGRFLRQAMTAEKLAESDQSSI